MSALEFCSLPCFPLKLVRGNTHIYKPNYYKDCPRMSVVIKQASIYLYLYRQHNDVDTDSDVADE